MPLVPLGARGCSWAPGGPFGGSKAFPEGSWVPLGGRGGLLGGAWAPRRGSWRTPWGARGRPWGLGVALRGAWGSLGATLGGPRGTLRDHFCKTGGIAKSLVLLHKMVHFACQGGLRGPRERQVRGQEGRRTGESEPRLPQRSKKQTKRSSGGKEETPVAPESLATH